MAPQLPLTLLARDFWRKLKDDNVFNGAAALGFYLTLAIFPAMIVTMAVIPYLPIERVDQAIMDLLYQALPGEAAGVFAGVVADVTRERRGGLLSFGLIATLWAASGGMYAVMQQLNVTHGVREGRPFVRARATALGLSLLFVVLVLGSLSLVVLGGVMQNWIGARWGYSGPLLTLFAVLRWVVIGIGLILAFALIYHLAPDRKDEFRFVSPGSVAAAVLLVATSLAFSFYVGHFADYDATYGGIGAVIVLMLWLYLAGLVILVGSVINVLAARRGGTGTRYAASGPPIEGGLMHTPNPGSDPHPDTRDDEEPDVRQPPVVPPDQAPDVVPQRDPPKPGRRPEPPMVV